MNGQPSGPAKCASETQVLRARVEDPGLAGVGEAHMNTLVNMDT